MIHTNQVNKIKTIVLFSYLLAFSIIAIVLYIIVTGIIKINTINPKMVQTHTTQLNIDNFNKILNQLKSDT